MAWPKGKPRGPRATNIAIGRDTDETDALAGIGHNSDRAVAQGRDGQALTRKRTVNSDVFHIPDDIVPNGWVYQWNPVEVLNKPLSAVESSIALAMEENGWRPVPAGRHMGRYMPAGTSAGAAIIRDGLRLDERPAILQEEAKAEEHAKAVQQMRDQHQILSLGSKMPAGFSRDNAKLQRMERAGTSRTIAPAPDIPRPQLRIDPAG